MKTLVIMPVFNRCNLTAQTLAGLTETVNLNQIKLVIVNNGSTDGTAVMIDEWTSLFNDTMPGQLDVIVHDLKENIGCPRALNLAMREHRLPGQDVIKLDNDVALMTPGWLWGVNGVAAAMDRAGKKVAMIMAHYRGATDGRASGMVPSPIPGGKDLVRMRHIIGHCVWHSGAFLDMVGFFDVLRGDHLYGFEDMLISLRASMIAWQMLVMPEWEVENLQRWTSLGRDEAAKHIEEMRPLYDRRRATISCRETLYTDEHGAAVPIGDPAVGRWLCDRRKGLEE